MTTRWSVVVPVKDTTVGKSRLAAYGAARPSLARAMATDTLDAVAAASTVGLVVVVTSDPTIPLPDGAVRIDDPARGLNAAVRAGAERAWACGGPVAILTGDLPALRSSELDDALAAAASYPLAVVADADGVGTTLLAATEASLLDPRFGEESLAAHVAAGAVRLRVAVGSGLRRDVDRPEHLSALHPRLGPRTAAVVAGTAVA